MNENAIIEKLDELIAVTKAAAFPVSERWLDAIGIGALICQEPRYVLQRLACRADFPKPTRIGHPRWKASEVLQWMEDTRMVCTSLAGSVCRHEYAPNQRQQIRLMIEHAVIEKLNELIAAVKAASVPFEHQWLSAIEVGAMISQSPRAVLEQYACKPNFPKANRVGRPRWEAIEVAEWMEDTRSGAHKPGRKRLPP